MGGIVSVVGFLSNVSQDAMPNVALQAIVKGATVRGVLGGSKQQLQEVVEIFQNRKMAVPVHQMFSYTKEGIVDAFECVASGKFLGKVCIRLR
jgi:D-arabinose 1-dehydrogenase-like Zn-dependent alcohol dehydrogenase